MADNKVNNFLNNISQIESSGGQNLNHKEVQNGIQAGTSAIGKYGLMPNTLREIARRQKMAGNDNIEYDLLGQLNNDQLKSYMEQSPELEQEMAEFLANKVLNQNAGNEEKAAYSWNQGSNLSPTQIEQRHYQDNPYVKKYQGLEQQNPNPASMSAQEQPQSQGQQDPITMNKSIIPSSISNLPNQIENTINQLPGGKIMSLLGSILSHYGKKALAKGAQNISNASPTLVDGVKLDPTGIIGGVGSIADVGAERAGLSGAEHAGLANAAEHLGAAGMQNDPALQQVFDLLQEKGTSVSKAPEAGSQISKNEMQAALDNSERESLAPYLQKYGSQLPEKQVVEQNALDARQMQNQGRGNMMPASMESYLPENIGQSSLVNPVDTSPIYENKPIDLKPLKNSGDFPEYDIENPHLVESSMSPDTYNRIQALQNLKNKLGIQD